MSYIDITVKKCIYIHDVMCYNSSVFVSRGLAEMNKFFKAVTMVAMAGFSMVLPSHAQKSSQVTSDEAKKRFNVPKMEALSQLIGAPVEYKAFPGEGLVKRSVMAGQAVIEREILGKDGKLRTVKILGRYDDLDGNGVIDESDLVYGHVEMTEYEKASFDDSNSELNVNLVYEDFGTVSSTNREAGTYASHYLHQYGDEKDQGEEFVNEEGSTATMLQEYHGAVQEIVGGFGQNPTQSFQKALVYKKQ
jgi:hypothetical protein